MNASHDLRGEQFGRLTIARQIDGHVAARCACGSEFTALVVSVLTGSVQSCGCRAPAREWIPAGFANEANIWRGMVARCYDPRSVHWDSYGGRGIRVAREWLERLGFARFLEHVGGRPCERYSIDRIDNDGNYQPGNLRWATKETQLQNRRATNYERVSASHSVRLRGNTFGSSAIERLTDEIRSALVEQFGAPRNELRPADFVVEQAFWESDYSTDSFHWEGVHDFVLATKPKLPRSWGQGPTGRKAA